jgi:hypothetical protein
MRRLVRRLRRLGFTIGFLVLGASLFLASAFSALYIGLFLRSMSRYHWALDHLIILLVLWQTQTGAAFALAAALIGAGVILHQTQDNRRKEEEQRERRAFALRATLAPSLSKLSDYATRSAKMLADAFTISGHITFPEVPDGLVMQLTAFIEAAKTDHAKPFIVLVTRLQFQHSRMLKLQRQSNLSQTEVLLCLVGTAEIQARCCELLDYARCETDAPPAVITASDVSFAVSTMKISIPQLQKQIDFYAKEGELGLPWPQN